MKWSEQVRDGVAAHLQAHGLGKCPVCQSETLEVCDKPALMVLGGAAWPNPPHVGPMDPDTAVDFMARVDCDECGYTVLFNSDRFYGAGIPAFEAELARSV
jgi:hypothetical protein